jgi:hypothetical protein
VVPGKKVLAAIARMVQEEFKVTLTPPRILDQMTVADVDPDVFQIINDVEKHLFSTDTA